MITINFDNPAHLSAVLFCILLCFLIGAFFGHDDTPLPVMGACGVIIFATAAAFIVNIACTIFQNL